MASPSSAHRTSRHNDEMGCHNPVAIRMAVSNTSIGNREANHADQCADDFKSNSRAMYRECLQCLRWCSQCRAESLNEDPIMMRDCIRLCNECLELCRTCVALLTGSSEFAHRVCRICSELCTACASECGKYDGETMRKCAEACRQCAATCAEVAQAGPLRRAAA